MERLTKSPTFELHPNRWIVKQFNLRKALSYVTIEGMFLEFGVFQGQSINFIASEIAGQTIYGFDGWHGLPEPWTTTKTTHEVGYLSVGGVLPKVCPNVTLISGMFKSTLPDFVKEHREKIAFVHMDCDLYSSTKTVLDNIGPLLVKGSVIVFDEWHVPGGEDRAFHEWLNENDRYATSVFSTSQQMTFIID